MRMEELSAQIGDGNGGEGGYYQEQLASGDWLIWTDNSFETLLMEDILRIAEVNGVEEYNITTANTVVNPVNFERIEDKDVDQSSDQRACRSEGPSAWSWILTSRKETLK